MSSRSATWDEGEKPLWLVTSWLLRPLHLGLAFPSFLYLAAMTVFLFRPPDVYLYYADRIAFVGLVFFVALRTMARREKFPFVPSLSLPMIGLTALAVIRALREPFDAQTWSIIASKFIVPFTLFHLAILVFRGAWERRHFRIFVTLTLAYLVFTAIAFLLGARSLIFPRFILDESMGFHMDRARGPFLQAVANGVSLNLLGILAVALFDKRKTAVLLLWLVLPLAVLATMTRAVWTSFAISAVILGSRLVARRLRCACIALVVAAGLLTGLAVGMSGLSLKTALWDRTAERGPVEARVAVYHAGWTMFLQRPLAGWPTRTMYTELARRMEGYHLRAFYVHNTYLALLVEFGVPGLAIYSLLFFNLFRLARRGAPGEPGPVASLRKVWPILLMVYLFNAFFVDMEYQFVIGLMFTVAGMLCSSEAEA
jgi:putative inorganic carbon (hco3(-)) transporter